MSISDFIKRQVLLAFLFKRGQVKQKNNSLGQHKPIRIIDVVRQQELKRVDAKLASLKELRPTAIPSLVPNHRSGVVWRIPVPTLADVFMCLRGGEHPVGQSDFVVYVRGLAFYRAWLTLDVNHYQPCPLQQDMHSDYKFHNAAKGFSTGIENPVPITNMGMLARDGELLINFLDGITRTLWLLANNVEVFPVHCQDLASASLLANQAGVTDPIPIPILEQRLVANNLVM